MALATSPARPGAAHPHDRIWAPRHDRIAGSKTTPAPIDPRIYAGSPQAYFRGSGQL